tara:strand:- start:2496 stop:2726 length:231 start_codon:yes stop_codon:yes gene_type:complete
MNDTELLVNLLVDLAMGARKKGLDIITMTMGPIFDTDENDKKVANLGTWKVTVERIDEDEDEEKDVMFDSGDSDGE